jgi:HK97 family phage major capsid protein
MSTNTNTPIESQLFNKLTEMGSEIKGLEQTVKEVTSSAVSNEQFSELNESVTKLSQEFGETQKQLNQLAERVETEPAQVTSHYDGFEGFGRYLAHTYEVASNKPAHEQLTQYFRREYESRGLEFTNVSNIGSSGGWLVPKDIASQIMSVVVDANPILSQVKRVSTSSNRYEIPIRKQTDLGTGMAGGVVAYWTKEAASIDTSDASWEMLSIEVHKLAALCSATEELLTGSPYNIASQIQAFMTDAVSQKLMDSMINGTGAGELSGLMNAGCKVTQDKESGPQTADTVVYNNVLKMHSRILPQYQGAYTWLITPSVFTQLATMSLDVGTGGSAVYLPAGGASARPYQTLMGMPVYSNMFGQALGDEGDIIAFAPQSYVLVEGYTKFDTSMHFYFDTDKEALRLITRVGGAPWVTRALPLPNDASYTMSPIVTLQTR